MIHFILEALFKSTHLTFQILLIIAAALSFSEFMKQSGRMNKIQTIFKDLNSCPQVQGIWIAFILGSFIEGIAGFGTPAAITAPLLVSMGFTAEKAVITSLTANSAAVLFGALGTPIVMGLQSAQFTTEIVNSGLASARGLQWAIGITTPILIAKLIGPLTRGKLAWAILVGVTFSGISWITSRYTLYLPSVFAAIGAFLISVLFFWVPGFSDKNNRPQFSLILDSAFFPYGILILLILIGSWIPHFRPSYAFFLVLLLFRAPLLSLIRTTLPKMKRVSALTFSTVFSVQILLHAHWDWTSHIQHGYQSSFGPYFSLFFGVLGSFASGSATVSNLIFSPIIEKSMISPAMFSTTGPLIGMQLIGAAIGNIIAITNVLAAQAATDSKTSTWFLIKKLGIHTCILFLACSLVFHFIL